MSEAKATELISSQSLVCDCEPERIEDEISLNDFSDEILRHILSYLSTKYAVRTSALSKRWRYLWTPRSNLDFQEEIWRFSLYRPQDQKTVFYGSKLNPKSRYTSRNREHFMNFVERVLFYPDDVSKNIHKFSLSCDVQHHLERIHTWISTAVMRNTQEFNLCLGRSTVTIIGKGLFPDCLFVSETIEVLKIEGRYSGAQELPQVNLPCLKVLTLENMNFYNHHTINLLFSSQALEELAINNCGWLWDINDEDERVITISAPKLRSLTIDESKMGSYSIDITISAPALENFNFRGEFNREYIFSCSSSISKAALGFHKFINLTEVNVNHFDDVFISLQSVKYLKLSTCVFMLLNHTTVPKLKNLICLEIPEEVDLDYLGSKRLGMMLNKCPSLETLRFSGGFSETYNYDVLLNSKFICSSSTLKNIVIGRFQGHSKELCAMHILLEKVAFLDILEISFAKNVERRSEIENLLSVIPRSSNSCNLCFRWPN